MAQRRVAALAFLLSGTLAVAASGTRVVLVPLAAQEGVTEREAARVGSLLIDECARRAELKVVESKGATGALEAGQRALDELQFERAADALKRGLDALLADPAGVDFGQLTAAHVKLATALFRAGEERAAKQTLTDLLTFAPSFHLTAGFPPVFRGELEKARKRAQKRGKGQLSIEGPRDAKAFVDGKPLGRVPVLISRLPVGSHLVKVEGAAGERFGQIVEVTTRLAKVRATFASRPAVLDESDLKRVAALGRAADADFALVGIVTRSSGTQLTAIVALYSREASGFVALEPVSFETDVTAARQRIEGLIDDLANHLSVFGAPGELPLNLASRPPAIVQTASPVAPTPVLVPAVTPKAESPEARAREALAPVRAEPEAKKGPPTWALIVAGVAVGAGVGVGVYLGYSALNRPVTGSVSATW